MRTFRTCFFKCDLHLKKRSLRSFCDFLRFKGHLLRGKRIDNIRQEIMSDDARSTDFGTAASEKQFLFVFVYVILAGRDRLIVVKNKMGPRLLTKTFFHFIFLIFFLGSVLNYHVFCFAVGRCSSV